MLNFLKFTFNWRIIALQYCVSLRHTSTWISHRYSMSPPSWISLLPPTPSHSSRLSQSTWFELPPSYSKFPLAIYFAYVNVYVSVLLSIHYTLFFPHCVHMSVLYVCISVAALPIGSSVPSFYIPYICVNMWHLFFSFWLTSLYAIGSRFIYLIEVKWSKSHSVVSNSLQPHGLYCPWNSPGQNTRVGSHSFLQGIFPTQGSNPGLLRCRWILYQLSHQESPSTSLGLTQMCSFYGWVIFHCLYIPQLLYPFICRWTFRLLLCPNCCK